MNSLQNNILLIEDDADARFLVQEMLRDVKDFSFSLEQASQLSTGIRKLNKEKIDVILLDLTLPDSKGLNTFITLHAKSPNTPIVVLSGLTDEAIATETLKNGAQDYLIKGQINGNLLVRALRYSIERKRAELSQQKMEEELRISHKMASIGRLTASVFHEILNPVNIISSHIQLMLMEAKEGSKAENDLKSILEEIKRIVTITDGLMRFSRKEAHILEEIETNDLLEETLSFIGPESKSKNIKTIRKFEKELPKVMAHTDDLGQVFLSLITNAIDAMPEGGTLTICTQSIQVNGNSFVSIKFADTGCGIARKNIDKLFEPFFSTRKDSVVGVGLGLSTSYAIIEGYGGKICVESEEGKGATFTVNLPVKG